MPIRPTAFTLAASLLAACNHTDTTPLDATTPDVLVHDVPRVDTSPDVDVSDSGPPPDHDSATDAGNDVLPVPTSVCTGRDADGGVPPDRFPGSACTGVPAGTKLTRVPADARSGAGWHVDHVGSDDVFYVTQAGAVLDSLDISLCVKVFANDVTIRRSRIRCASYYLVTPADPPTEYHGLTLTDVELDGLGNAAAQSIAVLATAGAHYLRLDVHGVASSGPRLTDDDVLEDSYLHDFACQAPDHSAGTSANGPGRHIVVRHNHIDIHTSCATAAWEISRDFGTFDDVLTERNLFDGGSYCAYAAVVMPGSSYGQATNIRFLNNTFGRAYHPECGSNGPIAEWGTQGASVWMGNVWGDGAAATADHHVGDPVVP